MKPKISAVFELDILMLLAVREASEMPIFQGDKLKAEFVYCDLNEDRITGIRVIVDDEKKEHL